MKMKTAIVRGLASLMAAFVGIVLATPSASAEVDVYTTEGTHFVNGRWWRTTCEPYSQTSRCRTEIKASFLTSETRNGRKVYVHHVNEWLFNNLTYLPSSRSLWKGNPLGKTGSWVAADGREWYTECDTAQTGQNGCGSYAKVQVIVNWGGYRVVDKFFLNNIVRFTPTPFPEPPPTPTPTPTPPPPADEVHFPDPWLRNCIAVGTAPITVEQVESIRSLNCRNLSSQIEDLSGIEALINLESLTLEGNKHGLDIEPLTGLTKLTELDLWRSIVPDPRPLARMNQLTSVGVTGPFEEGTFTPDLFEGFQHLEFLTITSGGITDASFVTQHQALKIVNLSFNPISDVTPFAELDNLTRLILIETDVTDWSPLDERVAAGLQIVTEPWW